MERIPTGIQGLDDMLRGGLPPNQTIVVIGSFGTGKSIFGLQFIFEGLKNGESAVYISLDEDESELIETAKNSGWEIKQYIDNGKLALIKLDAADIKASITQIQSELPRLIESFKPQRVVIDPVTLLEMLFSDESERRVNLFSLCQMIKSSGSTVVLITETDKLSNYSSKFGLVEYLADGVIVLRYIRAERVEDLREAQLAIEIVKMRRIEHSREIRPYSITNNGLVVHSEVGLF